MSRGRLRALVAAGGAALLALGAGTSRAQVAGTSPALARADSAWAAEKYDLARVAYTEVVFADSTSSRALFRLATLLSWNNQLDEAIALHRRYIRLEPADVEGRIALARTLAWAQRYDESIAVYDSVVAAHAGHRDAALGAAQTLAWASAFRASIARYDDWLRLHPDDREARLALARTYAWAGRLGDAERLYEQARAAGDTAEAVKGIARVAGWNGDLPRSIALWRMLSARYPRDPEVWVGLAQVLRWYSDPEAAEAALDRALGIRPGHADALAQRAWVSADLGPSTGPAILWTSDSDDSKSTTFIADASFRPIDRFRLGVAGMHREASSPGAKGRVSEGRLTTRWWPGRGVIGRAEIGVAHTAPDGPAESANTLVAMGSVVAPLHPRLWAGGSVVREAFAETAPLIQNGITSTSFDASADLTLPYRVTASLFGGLARISGGSVDNTRGSGGAALRWAVRRWLRVGATARGFAYERSPFDGYFSPRRFTVVEGNLRLATVRELGWYAEADAGLGTQRVKFDAPPESRGAQRVSLGLGYRPSPASEITVAWWYANVASTSSIADVGGASDYSATGATLKARLPVRW